MMQKEPRAKSCCNYLPIDSHILQQRPGIGSVPLLTRPVEGSNKAAGTNTDRDVFLNHKHRLPGGPSTGADNIRRLTIRQQTIPVLTGNLSLTSALNFYKAMFTPVAI